MIRKREFSTRWVELTMGVCLVLIVVRGAFAEVWTAAPAPTPPTITAPSGPTMLMLGETLTCTCTRGSDKDTLGASACEPGVQYDDEMTTSGNYPEWSASGGTWQNGNNKGTSVVWVAPTDPGLVGTYTIWVKDDDLPKAIVPPDTGNRNDGPAQSASKTVYVVNITQSPEDVWWFNGCDAALYCETGTLTLNGVLFFTFDWEVVQGQDKIDFWNDMDEQIVVNNNTVSFKSTAGSADEDDVKVEVRLSGVSGKASKLLTIYMPKKLTHLRDTDSPWGQWGYLSEIHYSIQDNLDRPMVDDIELNEQWTSNDVSNYTGENWPQPSPTGGTRDPTDWQDYFGITDPNLTFTPTPLNPQKPSLGTTKVDHWSGDWYVGSVTPGLGVKVHSTVWQSYQDHGRHE